MSVRSTKCVDDSEPGSGAQMARRLQRLGLAPPGIAPQEFASLFSGEGIDLLPALRQLIIGHAEGTTCAGQGAVRRLDDIAARQGFLQRRADLSGNLPDDWRIYLSLDPPWPGTGIGLLCSRLGKDLSRHRPVVDAVRTLYRNIDRRSYVVFGQDTAIDPLASRAAGLFVVPCAVMRPFPACASAQWLDSILGQRGDAAHPLRSIYVSHSLDGDAQRQSRRARRGPAVDTVVAEFAAELRILHVRGGGLVMRTVDRLLWEQTLPKRTIYVLIDGNRPDVVKQLSHRGAIGWKLPDLSPMSRRDTGRGGPAAPRIEFSSVRWSDFLVHCTRGPLGAWPDQSKNAFLDQLLSGDTASDRSDLAALCRIVTQQRLLAAGKLIRQQVPVVCLTEIPLDELLGQRRYRAHLGRWDFQPYGFAIRRDVAQRLGARPVLYGDDQTWSRIPAGERPFFQPRRSRSSRSPDEDWSAQREWRMVGDLDLRRAGPSDGIVFVACEREAELIASYSRWPVTVVPWAADVCETSN